MSTPAAYISYAWGDDKSDAGREREEIVDALCRSFAEVGIVIGRDKNEVKPGDSIEAFGARIAKAPLILAVISARSLRSEWCMLYELYEAYTRRGGSDKEFNSDVVALVLEDAEGDLKDEGELVKYWKAWRCKRKKVLKSADRKAKRSLKSRAVLIKCRDMIRSLPDMLLAINRIAMPRGSAAIRLDNFAAIRAHVQRKLDTPFSSSLEDSSIDQAGISATTPALSRVSADAVALVLKCSGGEEGPMRSYEWKAFVQRSGEPEYQGIANGEVGADPACSRATLKELLRRLKSWMAQQLTDVSVLEIFAPSELLDEDWGSMNVEDKEEETPLHSYQPYLLRSSDRLFNPKMNEKKGSLSRMHDLLVAGTGVWLPEDHLTMAHELKTLDGETQDGKAGGVVAAICCPRASMMPNKTTWLRWAEESMAPLVVWPSRKGLLPEEPKEEEVWSCLGELSLTREDGSQGRKVNRPHCPDLFRLAKIRRSMAKVDWPHPKIDLGLTILVDHPGRAPDLSELQAHFSSPREDATRAREEEQPPPPTQQLLISP
ncbi:MAG: toll/interleukin-1 receptor domain-containing protein [Cyanobacteriota bacterium]|jgi:hypothetical protein